MPFLVDSVTLELAAHGYGTHLVIHPVMRIVPRRARVRCWTCSTPARRARRRRAESRSSMSSSIASRTGPGSPSCTGTSSACSGRCARAVEDWEPMRSHARALIARARRGARADQRRRARRGAELPASGSPPITSRSSATASTRWSTDDGDARLVAIADSGLGILRGPPTGRRRPSSARRATRARDGAVAAGADEGQLRRHRAPPRVSGLRRRQAVRRRTAR